MWVSISLKLLLAGVVRLAGSSCFKGFVAMEWEYMYQSCCWECDPFCFPDLSDEARREHCIECCCNEINYTSVRQSMFAYAPTLLHTDFARVAHAMLDVSVASFYMWDYCLRPADSWLTSPEPLGVLTLRLFHLIGLVELKQSGTSDLLQHVLWGMDRTDGKATATHRNNIVVQTLQHLWTTFQTMSFSEMKGSGWPLFLLAWVLSLRLPTLAPAGILMNRSRLQLDTGPDGSFFRALWAYMNVSSFIEQPDTATMFGPEVSLSAGRVSGQLRPLANLAQAVLAQEQVGLSLGIGDLHDVRPLSAHQAASSLMSASPNLRHLLFNEFPVLPLLDRLTLEPVTNVEHGVVLHLPTVRGLQVDVEGLKAAIIRARGETSCSQELSAILSAGRIRRVVDVGAQFGACASVAARRFPEVEFLAIEVVEANLALMRRTVAINNLRNLRTQLLHLSSSRDDCSGSADGNTSVCHEGDGTAPGRTARLFACYCSTLDDEYPFQFMHEVSGGRRGAQGRLYEPGTLLWLSELGGSVEPILKGGAQLFKHRLVDAVGIVTTDVHLPAVRQHLGTGYSIANKPGAFSAVFMLATRRAP